MRIRFHTSIQCCLHSVGKRRGAAQAALQLWRKGACQRSMSTRLSPSSSQIHETRVLLSAQRYRQHRCLGFWAESVKRRPSCTLAQQTLAAGSQSANSRLEKTGNLKRCADWTTSLRARRWDFTSSDSQHAIHHKTADLELLVLCGDFEPCSTNCNLQPVSALTSHRHINFLASKRFSRFCPLCLASRTLAEPASGLASAVTARSRYGHPACAPVP